KCYQLNPDSNHINDDLLVKCLLGEATEEERVLAEAWINRDAANRKHWEDLKTIWQESKRLAAISTVDEDAAWHRFRSGINKSKRAAAVRTMEPWAWWKMAALFILIAGAVYFGSKL